MNIHFIAIGGSAMHNLAIALSRKGYHVTGSDDEIFEPSRSRLQKQGILPKQDGWNDEMIHENLDAIIVGMHARQDNPELKKAQELGLKLYSYPEYIYEQTKNKTRVVIGGSHGKTTITSMILHVLHKLGRDVDYMVGAQLEGFDCMVKLTDGNDIAILEGDEYLSSPTDLRPKFHLYQPNIALISGIAWDHINVFKTYEDYFKQFEIFCKKISTGGTLIYCADDEEVKKVSEAAPQHLNKIPYQNPPYEIINEQTIWKENGKDHPIAIFGKHNMTNLNGAKKVLYELGVSDDEFFACIQDFTGASKRLEKVEEKKEGNFVMYKDFAHAPSKLKATLAAICEQYDERKVIACLELHTFSSLNPKFFPFYRDSMNAADVAYVYFNPKAVKHKKLPAIDADLLVKSFGEGQVKVFQDSGKLKKELLSNSFNNSVLLVMSSGNFDGYDFNQLGRDITNQL